MRLEHSHLANAPEEGECMAGVMKSARMVLAAVIGSAESRIHKFGRLGMKRHGSFWQIFIRE
jgi:hypothetical protein